MEQGVQPAAAVSGSQPRERADRSEKLRQRRVTVETVVKASLLKHLVGDRKHLLRCAIQERVDVFSQRYHIASIALSGLLKHCFHGIEDVTAAQLPDLTCQSFFRQLMLGVADAVKPDAHVQAYYAAHPLLAAKLPAQRHQGDRNIYSAGAKKYLTNLRNHYVVGFKARLGKYLRAFQRANALTDQQRVWMLFQICGWTLPQDLAAVPVQQVMQQAVAAHRRILGLEGSKGVSPRWLDCKGTLHHLVRHAFHVCRYLEAAALPAFNLVPVVRRGAHFITIDTYVLYGLLKDLKVVACNEDAFVALAAEHKKAADDVPAMAAAPKTNSPLASSLNEHCILGNDPGRTNIYYIAMERFDGLVSSWKLTRGRYYAESGITAAKQQTETWQHALQQPLQRLSEVSSKGTGLAAHQAFLTVWADTYGVLWTEYLKQRWARQRLRLYGGKKRAFATFLNSVAKEAAKEGKPVVVAYGAAKFAPGGKGELSVPTSRAYKECMQRFSTVLVDEFRTTMVHAGTGSVLKQVWSQRKEAAVRGLMWCDSTNSSKFVNRDLNAALNIRRCLASPVRPAELCRVAGQSKLSKVVGKRICC